MEVNQQSGKEKNLNLFIYGSCESDQYYHPRFEGGSKRPICLSDIQKFKEDEDDEEEASMVRNPLFKASIYKIACGALHTIVITTEGEAYTFGCNDEGALGRPGRESIPIRVDLDEPVHMASAGDNHSVFANSRTGTIFFTGSYKYMRGESISEKVFTPIKYKIADIDYKLRNKQIDKLVSGSNHTAVIVDQRIFVRGQPQTHTTGRRISSRHKEKSCLTFEGVNLHNVDDLWCGGYHNIAKVWKEGEWVYYVWGLNKHGQLGLGDYNEYNYIQENKFLKGKNVVDVAAGLNFTVVLTDKGQLFGCGQNDCSQLGLGKGYVYKSEEENDKEIENNEKEEEEKVEEKIEEKPAENVKDQNIKVYEEKEVKGQKKIEEQPSVLENPNPEGDIPQSPKDAPPAEVIQVNQPQEQENPLPEVSQKKNEDIPEDRQEEVHEQTHRKEETIYIKSFRRINIPDRINRIKAGQQFCFGWNEKSLYSWGFGTNYVLLNGQEEDESAPFEVRPKVLKEQVIYQLAAGAQHVAYLSYSSGNKRPAPKLSEKAEQKILLAKESLKKKKRVR